MISSAQLSVAMNAISELAMSALVAKDIPLRLARVIVDGSPRRSPVLV
ncbi:hypothetical protein MOD31_12335 [Paenarthrobacter sp. TYUT067]|nr:hypothetical protein [Paenarthrobacter sp. TYUT067]MCM0616816.1 hypothetical protein [Paenarthrobacter sp. TYUT067]